MKHNSTTQSNNCVTCILCPKKVYKSNQGLRWHEAIQHQYYNTPPSNHLVFPQQHINEVKEILVYLIQTRLKINTTDAESQCISIPCTESEFVGVFCGFIDHYLPKGNQYSCIFQGSDAYETLSKILN